MILYFSGTGNSEYAAKRIGKEIDDEVINLFDKIRNNDFSEMSSERPWVIVLPTYAWRIPRIAEDWLKRTSLAGNRDIYFVMTCGENIGNAGKYLEKLCAEKRMNYRGCIGVTMPENYIALFTTPTGEKALQIIERAECVIDHVAHLIQSGESFPQPNISFGDKMSSGIVNDIFYPLFVHAKKFYVTDECISCGKCVNVCPMNNVHLENGKPVWESNCTHCMACICRCPKEAIEYGKHSKGLPRYVCKKRSVGGEAVLSKYFSKVQRFDYEDALAVTNVEDILDYIYSLPSMTEIADLDRNVVRGALEQKMVDGVLYIPKEYGMFVCGK